MHFEGASNYINVPLSAFLIDQNGQCAIQVVNLPSDAGSNVIFGANFYMAFFVAQQSTYALTGTSEVLTGVELQIFVSHQ